MIWKNYFSCVCGKTIHFNSFFRNQYNDKLNMICDKCNKARDFKFVKNEVIDNDL